jgi:mRNA-degrading endonuclease RelE of RelBE toxin-antitoxin system
LVLVKLIFYFKHIKKTIIKYDKPTRDRIYSVLNSRHNGDVKRMQVYDNPPYFRLRVRDIRALFIKDDGRMEIFVFDINYRGDIYT